MKRCSSALKNRDPGAHSLLTTFKGRAGMFIAAREVRAPTERRVNLCQSLRIFDSVVFLANNGSIFYIYRKGV
jgi:hypothetical protein